MISRIGWIGLCVSLFLIQGSVMPFLFSGYWQPDLWLCTVVISVFAFGRKTALAFAVAGGILQDIVTGNFFGLHLFPYIMTTILTAVIIRDRYNRNWLVSVLVVILGTAIYLFFVWMVVFMSGEDVNFFLYLFYHGMGLLGANAAAAALLHPMLWNMKHEWEPKW